MRKILIMMFVVIVCVSLLSSCDKVWSRSNDSQPTTEGGSTETKYKLELANNYEIVNALKENYSAGEEVVIQLPTITEHYYELYVNGVKQEPDNPVSDDWTYTYYTFTMPNEDVIVRIEDKWVDIPEAPQG